MKKFYSSRSFRCGPNDNKSGGFRNTFQPTLCLPIVTLKTVSRSQKVSPRQSPGFLVKGPLSGHGLRVSGHPREMRDQENHYKRIEDGT